MTRILIAGGPRTGKTTLAAKLAEADPAIVVRHTDDLINTHSWSAASSEVATWIDAPDPWIIEGVAAVRALRKWLHAHPDEKPCDAIYFGIAPKVDLSPGQLAMLRACATMWWQIKAYVMDRGIAVTVF